MILLLLTTISRAQEPVPVHYTDVTVELAEPLYTVEVQRKGHEGACRMTVVLDADGALAAAHPEAPDGCIEPLAEIVADALKRSTFKPWVVDGVAVPATFQTLHRFELTRYEWWRSGTRPEDFPWPPPESGDAPGPYTMALPFLEQGELVRHRVPPQFPVGMPSGSVTCVVRMYVDADGRVYGAVTERCAEPYAENILRVAGKWRFHPFPEEAPEPGVFVLKLTMGMP